MAVGIFLLERSFKLLMCTLIFKKKKIEVLILGDRVDEWMVSYLLDTITGFDKRIHMSYKLRMIPLDLFASWCVILERR